MFHSKAIIACATAVLVFAGCWSNKGIKLGESPDTDNDSDTDDDTDSDSDSDSDSDFLDEGTPLISEELISSCWLAVVRSDQKVYVADVLTLEDGDSIVTGKFSTNAEFGHGEADETILAATPGWTDEGFIARYDGEGRVVWARKVGATSHGSSGGPHTALAATHDGGFVAAGFFIGTATLGAGEENETTLNESTGALLLARYDADGRLVWARNDGKWWALPSAIAVLSDGSMVVTGTIDGEITFGVGEPNETTIPDLNNGNYRPFIARYSSDGYLIWAKGQGGKDLGRTIGVDAGDRFVVGGSYNDEQYCVLGAGEPSEVTLPSPGGVFLAVFDIDGNLEWARAATSESTFTVDSAVSLDDGSLAISGLYKNSAIFLDETNPAELTADVGESDSEAYLARYSQEGDLMWASDSGSPDGMVRPWRGVTQLSDGTLLLTGTVEGTVVLGEGGPNETSVASSSGRQEPMAAVFGTDGKLGWAGKLMAGTFDGGTITETAALQDGTFLVSGGFEHTSKFLIGDDVQSVTVTGYHDAFILHVCPQ